MHAERPIGVYIHVPFCRYRCSYCSFAIVTGQEKRFEQWLEAVLTEAGKASIACADTVHLGGGTPSRLPGRLVGELLHRLRDSIPLLEGAEIAIEANPDDIERESIGSWLEAGITRVSLGVQSLEPTGLAAMGRPGSREESLTALEQLARAGVPSISADFIFGWPGQTISDWDRELTQLVKLPLQHLSLYALETDAMTPLVRAIAKGKLPAPSADLQAEMTDLAVDRLGAAGFDRYEISNFARPGQESRHNRKYWTDQPYRGFGPAAASYLDGERWTNPRRLGEYLHRALGGLPLAEHEPFDADRRAGEALIFGLRLLREGVDLERLEARYGAAPIARRRTVLERGREEDLVEQHEGAWRLTPRGALLADLLFVDLL